MRSPQHKQKAPTGGLRRGLLLERGGQGARSRAVPTIRRAKVGRLIDVGVGGPFFAAVQFRPLLKSAGRDLIRLPPGA
jgi:hypothetical protein